MLFCPSCHNTLTISKNPPKNKQLGRIDLTTPQNVSEITETTEEIDVISKLIKQIASGEPYDDSLLNELKLEQITKHKDFISLDKKTKSLIQEKVTTHNEKVDDSVGAYYVCRNCMFSKNIEPKSLIMSRMGSGNTNSYINLEKLENRKYSKILPLTRNYICPNKNCGTNKDKVDKEAVFFRVSGSMQVWYTCRICGNCWKGQ